MAYRTSFVNLTASGQILSGAGVLCSMYVNSTSSGTIKLYNGAAAADMGKTLGGTITPSAGFHYLGNIEASGGIYCATTNTIDVTFHVLSRD